MKVMQIYETILETICSNTEIGEEIYNIGKSDSLSNYGLDSMKTMQLVVEIERKLNFKFDDEELLLVNFDNIDSIYAAVKAACEKERR